MLENGEKLQKLPWHIAQIISENLQKICRNYVQIIDICRNDENSRKMLGIDDICSNCRKFVEIVGKFQKLIVNSENRRKFQGTLQKIV